MDRGEDGVQMVLALRTPLLAPKFSRRVLVEPAICSRERFGPFRRLYALPLTKL